MSPSPRRAMTVLWTFVTLVAVAIPVAVVSAQGFSWAIVNWKVRHDFPGVRRIEPKELADWLNDKARPQPVLLDVRTKPEFDVSQIHGARRVDPDATAAVIDLPKDQPIVTYCSVGYRSGGFAKKLSDAGYTNVQNLTGSIFQWANEGRPLEHDHQRVAQVHPYNRTWGRLLKPELRAPVPASGTGM